ncbi:MAG: aspartate--tRNA ligase [bacterium]
MLRTHTCGQLRKKEVGKVVTLCGWVHRRRDHGGLIFIDLRDRYGLTQLTFDPKISKTTWQEADKLRSEWVIKVQGKVVKRPAEMINSKLSTGEIEIEGKNLEILTQAKTPPFEIDEEKAHLANENIRLKYRFLDLRRKNLQEILEKRDKLIQYIRDYFHRLDFIEIQTPILANSSPEGARDYLVPSRLYPGKFYALPQAPQQFKQLLMVGGLDRYFQIAPCFRDEDPRADRHPGDFYQLDLEMSFVEQEDVWQTIEPLMIQLSQKFSGKKIKKKPFPKLTWHEAMAKYGSDKPDLRFDLPIEDISDLVKNSDFSIFTQTIKEGGVVKALRVRSGAKFSRSQIDELTQIAKDHGAKGLAYIILEGKSQKPEMKSPIIKFLGERVAKDIVKFLKAKSGDIVFFGADKWLRACKALGAVRDECGRRLNLKDNKSVAWVWVYDFPLYEYNEEEKKIDFSHNPFSLPQGGLKTLEKKDPLEILAYQYDLVCNGYEISSGAIRNHEPKIMYKAFEIAGYTKEEVDKKFGHMINAFSYGAPPHGGLAPGIDRLMMILWDCESIRDIYAFPKDGQARDVMLNVPAEVDPKQLKELRIKIDLEK